MRHWYLHVALGLILMFLFVITFSGESAYMLLIGSIALVLGSLVPDIDHPKSKIRQSLRVLMFLVILFCILFVLDIQNMVDFLSNYTDVPMLAAAIAALFASVFIVFLFDSMIPPHRGPMHRLTAAAVYGALCGIIALVVNSNAALTAGAGFAGYLSHLLGDLIE